MGSNVSESKSTNKLIRQIKSENGLLLDVKLTNSKIPTTSSNIGQSKPAKLHSHQTKSDEHLSGNNILSTKKQGVFHHHHQHQQSRHEQSKPSPHESNITPKKQVMSQTKLSTKSGGPTRTLAPLPGTEAVSRSLAKKRLHSKIGKLGPVRTTKSYPTCSTTTVGRDVTVKSKLIIPSTSKSQNLKPSKDSQLSRISSNKPTIINKDLKLSSKVCLDEVGSFNQ